MARKSLSPRETEFYNLLLQGWSDKKMAEHLGVSIYTARTIVKNVFNKLGVNSRLELVVKTRNHELKQKVDAHEASH